MSSFATTTRLRVLRWPAQDLSVLVLVPLADEAARRALQRRGRRAGAPLLAGLPAPLPVVAHVVRHVLRTLENAPEEKGRNEGRKKRTQKLRLSSTGCLKPMQVEHILTIGNQVHINTQ